MRPVPPGRVRRRGALAEKTARAVALDALVAGGVAAEQLDRELRSASLFPSDRAFATELVYGTIKMRRALEWSIARHATRPIAQIDQRLRWNLLMGAYQLLYLDRVPAHSAVDEAVELARAGGHPGIAGFANAVLRKVAGDPARPPVPTANGVPSDLGLYASLPDWIAAHLIDRFGFGTALEAARGMNHAPRRALRMRAGVAAASLARRSEGASLNPGRYGIPECVIVDHADSAAVREMVDSGLAAWQSEESQLAVHLLDPKPGEIVLDACSGRGVKTMMIAGRLAGNGAVWSIDDDERKLALLRAAADRGANRVVHAVRADARESYPAPVPAKFDAAIVDAPCSGLGIIGRRPEARWRKRENDPQRFSTVQGAVLGQAAARVRSGGRLLYATCSTSPVEGESIVDAFLANHGDWRSAPLALPSFDNIVKIGEYAITVPGIDGADGFFYALLHRETP